MADFYEPHLYMLAGNALVAFDVRDLGLKSRIIELTGTITRDLARSICRQIRTLLTCNDDPITIVIDSDGGNVSAGLMIIDAIRTCAAPIITVCAGRAYSMAALILAAGDKRRIMPHGQTLLHEMALPDGDYAGTDLTDLRRLVTAAVEAHDEIVKLLMDYTGKPQKIIEDTMATGMVIDAEDTVAFGLADEIIGEEEA